MAILLQVGTEVFNYPENGTNPQEQWGEEASAWAQAVTTLLASIQGPNDIAISAANIANNQPIPTSIVGLKFSTTAVQHISVEFVVIRNTASTTVVESGIIYGNYDGTDFNIALETVGNSGVSIDVDSTGQFLYTSTNLVGQTSATIKFKGNAISN
jgi:hypothetical protein